MQSPTPSPRIAVCPGTFDPVTYAHLDIIARAAQLFDRLIIGILNPPSRTQTTLFSLEERRQLLEESTHSLSNVVTARCETLVVDFARAHSATAIVKGLRAISDFEYELEMHQLNQKQAPDLESVFLMASADYSFMRSSGVKELATFGGNLDGMAPPCVISALGTKVQRRRT